MSDGFNSDISSSFLPERVKRALLTFRWHDATPAEIGQVTQLWLGRYELPQKFDRKESDK